MQFQKFTPKN